jgi:cell division transport system permease protein
MLFFLGIYFLFAFKSNQMVDKLKNETNYLIELEKEHTKEQLDEIKRIITDEMGLVQGSIVTVSSEQAKKMMIKDLGTEFLEVTEENPFFDVVQFKIESKLMDNENLINKYRSLDYVHNMYAEYSYVEEIARNVRVYSRVALLVGLFFTALAFLLIFNAIRLSLVESKSSFYTLKLLGADWNFIKKPFLQRAFYSGVSSGIIAIVFIVFVIVSIKLSNEIFKELISTIDILMISFAMLILGFLVNIMSTNYILNKYLKMKEEDLY